MCGIIKIKRHDGHSPIPQVLKRYEAQKSRGVEGFGFLAIKDGKLVSYARAETEEDIKAKLLAVDCDDLIFHHRFPTSTPNFKECAHPIRVSHDMLAYDYYTIHNGCLYDDEAYKKSHEQMGFKYTTECSTDWKVGGRSIYHEDKWNDSEALAIELALDLDRGGSGVDIMGSIAFITAQVDKTTNKVRHIFWGRNSYSPLRADTLKGVFTSLASEGQGKTVPTSMLFTYDYDTDETTEREYMVGGGDVVIPLVDIRDTDEPDMINLLAEEYDALERKVRTETLPAEEEDAIYDRLTMIEDELNLLSEERNPNYAS